MRAVLVAVALVVAFQLGRMLPTWESNGLSPRTVAAFAQAIDSCSQAGATAEAQECKLIEGLMDKIAVTSLERLGSRVAQRTEALRPEVRTALETAARQRLGDEVAVLIGQIAETKALMTRTADTLATTRKTLNRSEKLIDDSDEVIDDTKKVLKETEHALEKTEDVLNRTEALLNGTDALAARLREDLARVSNIIDRLRDALPRP
jgi:chromosome segregation ATPase